MYIILGKNGYIAQAIIKELQSRGLPHLAWSRSEVNYTDLADLKEAIHWAKVNNPNIFTIINCAGFIGKPNVDACELAKAECIEGNVLFPAMLARLSEEGGHRLAHISSGCIYGGYEKHFTEEDPPNFHFQNGSFYSGTKALGEKVVQENNRKPYIFRLRIPFDEHENPRNYITKMIKYDKLLNAENSLSHRGDFAKYTIELIEQQVPEGIYNITNKGSVTTRQVINLIKDHGVSNKKFSFFEDIDSFSETVTTPRSNCVLDTSKIESYIKTRSVEDALAESLSTYKPNS